MTGPPPPRHCPGCGRGHYVAVRFCPFCGAEQARDAPPPPQSPGGVPVGIAPVLLHLAPTPVERAVAAPARIPAPSPVPAVAPAPPPPVASRRGTRWRWGFGLRRAALAAAIIAGLAALALGRRDPMPAASRITVGPAWSAVTLAPLRAAPLMRIAGDGPFSLRLDGERVMRAAPGGTLLRPGPLRSLELRAGRGTVTVTLTPQRE